MSKEITESLRDPSCLSPFSPLYSQNGKATLGEEAADEIERLREEVNTLHKEVDVLVDHVLEVRGLLKECLQWLDLNAAPTLCDRVRKELSDD